MTTELTKAAQQALEACPFCGGEPQDARHIEYGRWAVTCRCGASGASADTGPNATDAAKIKAYSDARTAWNTRALTQRPAAQTEREAFEAWYCENVNRAVLPDYLPKLETYSSATVANLFSSWKAGAAWHRASLPAPQQATPTREAREAEQRERMQARLADRPASKATADFDLPAPNDAAQQATPAQEVHPLASRCYAMSEPHLSGYRLVLGFETLEAVDAAHTWVANVRKAPQQATPEPVGEVFYACPDELDMLRQRTVKHCLLSTFKAHGGKDVTLYTRPAPGVPEGWQPIQTAPTDGTKFLGWRGGRVATAYRVQRDDCEMWCFGGQSGAFEHWPETRPEFWMPHPPEPALAAAQAKGGR